MKNNLIALVLLLASVAFGADNSQKITASAPLTLASGVLAIPAGSASVNGYISSTDWTTFNSKASPGAYITSLTSDVTASGPGAAVATVAAVGGQTASAVAAATVLANNATSANTANQIVKRGASGQVSVGAITGGATALTGASSVTGNADAVQLFVKGNSTQTSDILQIKDSINSILFSVDNSGNGIFAGTLAASNLSGTNTGDVTLGAFGSTPDAKGATLTGQNLQVQPADASHPGSVSVTTQTFGGAKTFNGTVTAPTTVQTNIQDPGAIVSIDVSNRRLKDSTAVNSLDYQSRTLNDAAGTAVLAWGGAQTSAVTGNADKVQLQVKGFSTQTNNLFSVLKSDNTSLFSVNNSGNVAALGNVAATGTVTGSNLSGTNTGDVTLGTANGLSILAQVLSLQLSDSTHTGALSSADWTTFNSKQAAGSYITALTSDVSASGPGSAAATVNSVGGSTAANVHTAELAANAATALNTASTIVKRDGSGNFAASQITGTAFLAAGATAFVQAAPTTSGTDAIRAVNNSGVAGNVSIALQDSTLAKNFRFTADYVATPFMAFTYNGTNDGQLDSAGKWTLGASGGTQAHQLNGSLVSTGTLTAPAFISSAANPASAGVLRLQNTGLASWRNGANSGDLSLQVDASNQFLFDTGLSAIRVGTNAALTATPEQITNLDTVTTDVSGTGMRSRINGNTNTPLTGILVGLRGEGYRQITLDTTDTGQIGGLNSSIFVNVPAGKTYTNTSTLGLSSVRINGLALDVGTGSLAISNYQAINVLGDSTVTSGRKMGLRFNGMSGGAAGNTDIADNNAFTGDFFINQTSAKPSLLSGVVSLTDTTNANSTTTGSLTTLGGISSAKRIWSATALRAEGSISGDQVRVDVANDSNTASSDAAVNVTTAGLSAGNPLIRTQVTGGSVWSFGLNQADSSAFEIAPTSGLTSPVFKASTSGVITLGASGGSASHVINGNRLDLTGTNAGAVFEQINNLSTNAAADTALVLSVASIAAGDPYIQFQVPSNLWSVGVDNSDSKKFKINYSPSPSGGTTFMSATTAGAFTIGDTAGAAAHTVLGSMTMSPGAISGFQLTAGWNAAVGKSANATTDAVLTVAGNGYGAVTGQIGIYDVPTNTTSNTQEFIPLVVGGNTPNSVFTTARYSGLFAAAVNKGASHTITRASSAWLSPQTVGTAGNATITDSLTSVTGNFFIYSVDTNPSQFAGPIREANGSVSAPAYSFSGGTNHGMYFAGGGVRFAYNGLQVFNYSPNNVDMSQSGVTVNIDSGSIATPALSFGGHTGTGISRGGGTGEGVIISSAGVATATFSDQSATFVQQVRASDGLVSAPGYGFSSGTQNTGMYRIGAGDLGFTTASTKRLELDNVGNVVVGSGTTTTTKTADFIYMPTVAGTPTGVPSNTYSGSIPMVVDSTNNVLYVYNAGWISPSRAVGVTNGTDAGAGIVGEYQESLIAAATTYPTASATWGDATSKSLTAGNWDITACLDIVRNGSNVTAQAIGISTTTGNSATGLVNGQNAVRFTTVTLSGATDAITMCTPVYHQTFNATTTYYLKANMTYAGAAPTYSARLSARRMY